MLSKNDEVVAVRDGLVFKKGREGMVTEVTTIDLEEYLFVCTGEGRTIGPTLATYWKKKSHGSLVRSFRMNDKNYEHLIFCNEDDRIELQDEDSNVILTYDSNCYVWDKDKNKIGRFCTRDVKFNKETKQHTIANYDRDTPNNNFEYIIENRWVFIECGNEEEYSTWHVLNKVSEVEGLLDAEVVISKHYLSRL